MGFLRTGMCALILSEICWCPAKAWHVPDVPNTLCAGWGAGGGGGIIFPGHLSEMCVGKSGPCRFPSLVLQKSSNIYQAEHFIVNSLWSSGSSHRCQHSVVLFLLFSLSTLQPDWFLQSKAKALQCLTPLCFGPWLHLRTL